MTNYNDGMIHGWNGGDCPVHPETVVEVWSRDGMRDRNCAKLSIWAHDEAFSHEDIIAFQVVKQFVEPKVIWVNEYHDFLDTTHDTEEKAKHSAGKSCIRIAVKYVEVKE